MYRHAMTWTKTRAVFGIPTNMLGFAQGLPGCVPWGVIVAYLNDYMSQVCARRSLRAVVMWCVVSGCTFVYHSTPGM